MKNYYKKPIFIFSSIMLLTLLFSEPNMQNNEADRKEDIADSSEEVIPSVPEENEKKRQ